MNLARWHGASRTTLSCFWKAPWALCLGWPFIVGDYAGGILLILVMIAVVKLSEPRGLVERVRRRMRERAGEEDGDQRESRTPTWKRRIRSLQAWGRVSSN